MKMKKIIALATAAALCLGMSMTAFAADAVNPSPNKVPQSSSSYVNKEGYEAQTGELDAETKALLANEDKVKEILSQEFVVPKDAKVAVLGAGEYTLWDWTKDDVYKYQIEDGKVPNGGANFTFPIYDKDHDVKIGDTIYVLHKVGDKWEVTECVVTMGPNGDMVVDVFMESFSPVAFVKVMSDGTVVKLDAKGEPEKPVTKKAPKTGEF